MADEANVPDLSTPGRTFGWWDMFVHPDEDPREEKGWTGERDMLAGFARVNRQTFELKCQGLDAEGMATRGIEPSNLSLLGLLRHLADVERYWMGRVMAGQDLPWLHEGEAAWDVKADPAMVERAWSDWRTAVAFSEEFVANAASMDVTGVSGGKPEELRSVMVRLIEEYARHCGHADFLRERVDGRVGQ